jgi:hypothetical protein
MGVHVGKFEVFVSLNLCVHTCLRASLLCISLDGEQPEFEFVSFEVLSVGACLEVPAEVVSHEVLFLSQGEEELL